MARLVQRRVVGSSCFGGGRQVGVSRSAVFNLVRGGVEYLSATLPWIEQIAQGVSQEIGTEYDERDRQPGEDHQQRRGPQVFGRRFRQHAAPGGVRLGDAETEER